MFRETMEQSSSLFSLDDIEVAEILLELPRLISESEARSGFSFRWGATRRRSNVLRKTFAVKSLPTLKLLPSPPPPPPPPPPLLSDAVGSTYETEGHLEKVLTSSPATPLLFSPSESDEKPPPSQKKTSVNSLKRKKEHLLETMEDYTRSNELLKKEIKSKREFLDQQKAKNLELKAKKQELSQSLGKEEEEPRSDLDLQVTQSSMVTENNEDHHRQNFSFRQHQQLFIIGDMEINKNSPHPIGQIISWLPSPSNTERSSIRLDDNVGPIGLIDLNLPAEEAFEFSPNESSFDQSNSKARAAEARLKRMQICRSKNSNGSNKVRLPYR